MSRPASMKVDGIVYWTLATYDTAGVLVDADSTPTVAVRKNGASVADVVTITKRAATTGIYDCIHSPSGESEGDCFIYEESATISSVAYLNPWSLEVLAAERGTDNANTIAPVDVSSSVADILADTADLQANQSNWLTATTTVSSNMRGTDGANTVVPNTIAPDNASIAAILVDTADLQANQGQWITATGFNTVVPVDVSVDVAAILADTNELQGNQGDWATATTTVSSNMRGTDNASTFDHTSDAVITDTASRDASKANVSGLSTFDPSSDEVVTDAASRVASKADVSGLSTFDSSTDQVVASNMRGTDGANTVVPNTIAPVDVSADVAAILADTSDLQANQGNWLTATSTVASNMRGTDGANTVAPDNASIAAILVDTADLQANQSQWLTATATTASNAPSNWSVMSINGAGAIVTSNPSTGGTGSAHTAEDVAALILSVPTTPLNNTSAGALANVDLVDLVTTNTDMRGTDSANTVAPVDVSASVAAILADTADLQANQGQWLTATTTVSSNMRGTDGANTVAPVDVSSDVSAIKSKTDQFVFTVSGQVDANALTGGSGGSAPTAQEIVDAWGNQPQASYVTAGTLGYNLDAQVSQAGGSGSGLYQATVRVQDGSNNALQGARVNVDGTTLTLTTDSSGEVTFNLDSGVYLLEVSPPAGYDTPTGQVLTIASSDPSSTVFSLAGTSGGTGCDIPWVG